MKTLYLVRHASASIDSPTKKDIDRPLNHAGISEAESMATYLRKNGAQFNLIISSTAIRTVVTAQIIAKHFFYPLNEIRKEELIFLNNPEHIISLLASLGNELKHVLLVGHNSSITTIAQLLGNKPLSSFKPAGVACIEFDIEKWEQLSDGGILKYYSDPSLIAI